jgi:hypothetical protein
MTLRSGFGKFGVAAAGGKGSLATGGTIVALNGYNYHVFTSSGTFEVTELGNGSEEAGALVIAGGGAGGGRMGGGGGAGGVLYSSASFPLAIGAHTVTVGAGAATSPPWSPGATGRAKSGNNSEFYHPGTPTPQRAIALAGGGGGSYSYSYQNPNPSTPGGNWGSPGGSGGGIGGQYPVPGDLYGAADATIPGTQPSNNPNPSVWTTHGFPGGRGADGPYQGTGGGGSAASGNTSFGTSVYGPPGIATPPNAAINHGHGGIAQPFTGWPGPGLGLPAIPSDLWAAGGTGNGYGSGSGNSPGGTPAGDIRRNGIGGASGYETAPGGARPGTRLGVTNSGSGGGGGDYGGGSGGGAGGSGGSGIVIIRYLL